MLRVSNDSVQKSYTEKILLEKRMSWKFLSRTDGHVYMKSGVKPCGKINVTLLKMISRLNLTYDNFPFIEPCVFLQWIIYSNICCSLSSRGSLLVKNIGLRGLAFKPWSRNKEKRLRDRADLRGPEQLQEESERCFSGARVLVRSSYCGLWVCSEPY